MTDTIITVAAVAFAAFFVLRRLYRQINDGAVSCTCTGCAKCPSGQSCSGKEKE